MGLLAEINHSGEASARGLHLPETTLVIFGNPEIETRMIEAVPEAGLELPLKVLVWSEDLQTKVSYLMPTVLAARYGLSSDVASTLEIVSEIVAKAIDE